MGIRKVLLIAAATGMPFVALAQEPAPIVGTWKLVSFVTEFKDGTPARPVFGDKARGFSVYTPQGRYMVMMEADGRRPPGSEGERAALFSTMIAFTGAYTVDANARVTVRVDGALNPSFTGTQRVSNIRLEGERMHAVSPWAPSPVLPGAPMARGVTVWERVR